MVTRCWLRATTAMTGGPAGRDVTTPSPAASRCFDVEAASALQPPIAAAMPMRTRDAECANLFTPQWKPRLHSVLHHQHRFGRIGCAVERNLSRLAHTQPIANSKDAAALPANLQRPLLRVKLKREARGQLQL